MGQLFNRALKTGFMDVFDPTSSLENQLAGANASALYDARLSSAGYNKARTKTVEDELANRQLLRQRLLERGDPNALDRFDAGQGYAQDWMKGTVGRAKENRVVEELEKLRLGDKKDRYLGSGIRLGSTVQQTEAGGLSRTKSDIARENEDALTAAFDKVAEMGIDTNTKEGQALLVELMARGKFVSGTDLLISEQQKLIKQKTKTSQQRGLSFENNAASLEAHRIEKNRILEQYTTGKVAQLTAKNVTYAAIGTAKIALYDAKKLLTDQKLQVQKAVEVELEIKQALGEANLEKIYTTIDNAIRKAKAEIRHINQKIKSGQIKDKNVKEGLKLITEKINFEKLSYEKMESVISKIKKDTTKVGVEIDKLLAEKEGEIYQSAIKIAEFLGLDPSLPSGDAMMNNYTKMFATIFKANPVITDANNQFVYVKGYAPEENDQYPDGIIKLFSMLTDVEQKSFIEARMIQQVQNGIAGSNVSPEEKQTLEETFQTIVEFFKDEINQDPVKLGNLPEGLFTSLKNPLSELEGAPDAAEDAFRSKVDTSLTDPVSAALQQTAAIPGGQPQTEQPTDLATALESQPSQLPPSQPQEITGGNLDTQQQEAAKLVVNKIASDNGYSQQVAALFADLIATSGLPPDRIAELAALPVEKLKELILKNANSDRFGANFKTEILPIIQQMIKEKS